MSTFPAMSQVPAESLEAANEEIRRLQSDIVAYRGALGYSLPASHDGKLSSGETPMCGICNSLCRKEEEVQATRFRMIANAIADYINTK